MVRLRLKLLSWYLQHISSLPSIFIKAINANYLRYNGTIQYSPQKIFLPEKVNLDQSIRSFPFFQKYVRSKRTLFQLSSKYQASMQNQESVAKEKCGGNDRIYFSMLERVGTIGRYQYLLMTFIFIVGMQASSCFLVNPYLFYEQPFACPQGTPDCKQFVCALPAELRADYTPAPDGRLSLANQFGDFRCEGASFVTLLNSSIILGSVLGIASAIFFTQFLGRRRTMVFSLFISLLGLCLCFIFSQAAAVIGVFLYGAGLDIAYSCVFTFVTEFFSQQNRSKFYVIISLSFSVGIFLNPAAFYLIYDWKWVAIFVFILPILVAALGFIYIVENTPIELVAYYNAEEIYGAFMRIASWNQVTDHGLSLEAVRQIKQEYTQNQKKKHARVFTVIDLVRYQSIRWHLIPLGLLKFLSMFIYYAPGLLLDQFGMNIYINGLVNALSQLCGVPLQQLLVTTSRKFSNYLLYSLSAAFALAMWVVNQANNGNGGIAETVLLFFYRMFTTIASFIVVVMLNETYPAQVRNLAIFVNISFGRSSTLLVPFVPAFCAATHIPFLLLLGGASMLGTATTCFATETFGIPPPEMIQEVKILEHHYKYYHIQKDQEQAKKTKGR